MQWTVLLPVKALPEAKSRLAPATADLDSHRRLVEAIRRDTTAAARAARGVARVVQVFDHAEDTGGVEGGAPEIHTLVQSAPGLNGAICDAAAHALARWPDDGVAVLVGDLAALHPDELDAALRAAAEHGRSFVADHAGTGTTLLAATPGHQLHPEFGPGSAQRHGAAAVALDGGPGLRHDVDTAADLMTAWDLGLGEATREVLAAVGIAPPSTCSGIIGW